MIPVNTYRGRALVLFGLARSGIAAGRALMAGDAIVHAWDDNPAGREAGVAAGLTLADWRTLDWTGIAAVVLAPGVPLTHPKPHPLVDRAVAAGVPVIGDIELFVQAAAPRRLVGITGTNGKSTTTALIGHLLASAGRPVAVGGNIGRAAFDLPNLPDDGIYVLELSSFQLDLTPNWTGAVGIVTNITPDHLDRHGDMARYAAVKESVFGRRRSVGLAVVGLDDDYCRAMYDRLKARGANVIGVTIGRANQDGFAVVDGVLRDRGSAIFDLKTLPAMPGAHNWQNIAVAWAAVRALGVDDPAIQAGLRTFPGLAHRSERIGEIDGVVFINDSKATNAEATEKALLCWEGIYWIAGGRAKTGGIDALAPLFPRIRRAYLIGEAANDFADRLAGHTDTEIVGTLDRAVARAFADAKAEGRSGAVVLLSPACASFDQYRDFEDRGEAFRGLVQALAKSRSGAAA